MHIFNLVYVDKEAIKAKSVSSGAPSIIFIIFIAIYVVISAIEILTKPREK